MTRAQFLAAFVAVNAFLQACYHAFYNGAFGSVDGLVYILSITQDVWEITMSLILPSALTSSLGVLTDKNALFPDGLVTAGIMIGLSWPVGLLFYNRIVVIGWKKASILFIAVSAVLSVIEALVWMRLVF